MPATPQRVILVDRPVVTQGWRGGRSTDHGLDGDFILQHSVKSAKRGITASRAVPFGEIRYRIRRHSALQVFGAESGKRMFAGQKVQAPAIHTAEDTHVWERVSQGAGHSSEILRIAFREPLSQN